MQSKSILTTIITLIALASVVNAQTTGTISFDKESYSMGDFIRFKDDAIGTNNKVKVTIIALSNIVDEDRWVLVKSTSDPVGVKIPLVYSGSSVEPVLTSNYSGSFKLTTGPSQGDPSLGYFDYKLKVAGGDTITVVYTDKLAAGGQPLDVVATTAVKPWAEVTFDATNFPHDKGIGYTAQQTLLTVDGVGAGTLGVPTIGVNVLYFQPAKFIWDVGSTHTYEWTSALNCTSGLCGSVSVAGQKFTWESTTGLATARSGKLTVTASGSITATYKTGVTCGGLSFSDAIAFPSDFCDQEGGSIRYFSFTAGGNNYYAAVRTSTMRGAYKLKLVEVTDPVDPVNKPHRFFVILTYGYNTGYTLYAYDSNQQLMASSDKPGTSEAGFGYSVEIVPAMSASPTSPPTTTQAPTSALTTTPKPTTAPSSAICLPVAQAILEATGGCAKLDPKVYPNVYASCCQEVTKENLLGLLDASLADGKVDDNEKSGLLYALNAYLSRLL